MKIGLAIAPANALPSAFVVFRDELSVSIRKAADLGYDGVELALLDAGQVDLPEMQRLLRDHGLTVPVVSTGQVFAGAGLYLTHPDPAIRSRCVETFKGLCAVASELGAMVNVGRARGFIPTDEPREVAEARFQEGMREIADYAAGLGVTLILEPVNRYEINFVNSVAEGAAAIRRLERPNVRLMPDVFHMNIEDASIEGSFRELRDLVAYVHFADSNRWAPGQGHLDFASIVATLREIGYDGWVTAEILPYPDPDTAAAQAIRYLRTLIPK